MNLLSSNLAIIKPINFAKYKRLKDFVLKSHRVNY